MKYVNVVFCGLMILFAAVQYNDPDAIFWIPVYLVPAICAGFAAFRIQILRARLALGLLGLCLVLAILGSIFYWPQTPGFWRTEVWWETETAREGMGMMIVALAIGVAFLTAVRHALREGGR